MGEQQKPGRPKTEEEKKMMCKLPEGGGWVRPLAT